MRRIIAFLGLLGVLLLAAAGPAPAGNGKSPAWRFNSHETEATVSTGANAPSQFGHRARAGPNAVPSAPGEWPVASRKICKGDA